ncbi:hypothetical protein FI667_g8107, partial [Globisporangium splendens]
MITDEVDRNTETQKRGKDVEGEPIFSVDDGDRSGTAPPPTLTQVQDQFQRLDADFQTLAATFENWKAHDAMRHIVKRHRQEQLRHWRASMSPVCAHAVFHWVLVTLPETHSFETQSQVLPISVLQRMRNPPSTESMSVIQHVTLRLWVWKLRVIFHTWRSDTRKKHAFPPSSSGDALSLVVNLQVMLNNELQTAIAAKRSSRIGATGVHMCAMRMEFISRYLIVTGNAADAISETFSNVGNAGWRGITSSGSYVRDWKDVNGGKYIGWKSEGTGIRGAKQPKYNVASFVRFSVCIVAIYFLLHLDLVVHARYQCVLHIMRKCWHAFSDHVSTRRVQQLKVVERIQQESRARVSTCVHAWNVFTQTRLEQTRSHRARNAAGSPTACNVVSVAHRIPRGPNAAFGEAICRDFVQTTRVYVVAALLEAQTAGASSGSRSGDETWFAKDATHSRVLGSSRDLEKDASGCAWRHLYLLRVKQHDHVARVLDKWRHQQLQVTFLTWKPHWRLRQDHRRLVAMMHVTKKENTFANCFSMWKTAQMLALQQLHGTFLAEWLTQQIEARMTTLSICENVMRTKVHRRLLATTWQAWTQWQDRKRQQWVAIRRLQQQIAALSATSSKRYRMKDASTEPFDCSVRATLVRWRCLPVAKSFRKWAIDAHNERVLRESTLAALELWQKNHLRRTFAYWHVFSMTEKQQCVLARKSIFSKTSRCWRRWRHYVANAKRAKTQHTLATTQWRQRILDAYFSTWHHWRVHLQLQRRMVLQVYSVTCLRLVRALFEIWTQFAVSRRTKRVQTTVALVRYEAKLVRTSWQTWRTHTALSQYHRQQLQANTERLQILLLCSSFRGWRQCATQTRRLTNIARLLSSKCDTKTASTAIAAWHQHVQRKLHLQHTAVTFQRLAAFHKGLAALKHAMDAKKHHRAASDKSKLFVSILRDHQVARHFLRWQTLWILGRKKRFAIRHFHQQKLLPRVGTAWVQVVAFNKRSSDRLVMAAHAWKHAFVRKAWRALLAHHQLAIQRQERIVQGETHYTTRTLKAAIALWRHETAHIRRLNATSRKLLLRWRLQAVTRKCMQRAWRRWLEFREEARMLTQFQHAIAATYLRSTQTRLVAQWKQFVVDNKLRRAIALLSVESASTQVVRHTWHRWWRFVHHSHADKRKISTVVHRMRFHTQMKVLHAFQIHAVTRKRKRRLAERAATFHSMNLQTRGFREWKRVALTAKSHRAKLAHCVHSLQHSVQRKTFLAWSDFVEKRLELRTKMAKALALKTQLCTRTVWNAWTVFAHNSCRNKLAKRYCGARICTRSLHQWRKFVILCKAEHMLGASHKRMLENGFVAWRKLVARNHSVRAFQLKATQTHQKQQRSANIDGVSSPGDLDAITSPDILSEGCAATTSTYREEGDANSHEEPDELVSIAIALARKARFFQRFEITWDVPQTWQWWRHIFHARLFYRLRKLHAHFAVWQAWSHQRKRMRNVLTCFQGKRSVCALRTVLHGWKNVVQRVKQSQRQRLRDRELWTIVNTDMPEYQTRCAAQKLDAFCVVGEVGVRMHAFVASTAAFAFASTCECGAASSSARKTTGTHGLDPVVSRTSSSAPRSPRSAALSVSRQEQTELALRHFEWSLRRRTLNAWRYAMHDQQKKRFSLLSCMVKLASISGKRMLEVIWHSWCRWAERERRCRVLQFTLERNLEKKAFVSWHQRVGEKLKRKQQRRDAECYYTNRLVSVLFFYWQNYALAWKDVTEANSKLNSAPPTRRSRLRLNVAAVNNESGVAADGGEDDDDDLATPRFDANATDEEHLRRAENASGAAAEKSITARNKTYTRTCSGICTKFSPLMIAFTLCAAAFVLGSCRALDRCQETAGGSRQKVLQSIQGSVLLQFLLLTIQVRRLKLEELMGTNMHVT